MRGESAAYKKIDALIGVEAFKQFARKLLATSKNMETACVRQTPLPNLIFTAAPGAGVSTCLRLLAELLGELRLMPLVGEECCFEWALDGDDGGFDRLLRRVRVSGGFYGQFCGVIGLDISSMLDDGGAHGLERLMEYVDARQGEILFAFVIKRGVSERQRRWLMSAFSSRTPVELIDIPFPQPAQALAFICKTLSERGFLPRAEVERPLETIVAELIDAPGFEGYQTLQTLVDEIIWHKLSGENGANRTIVERDIAFIDEKNGFAAALAVENRQTGKRARRVGFEPERRPDNA